MFEKRFYKKGQVPRLETFTLFKIITALVVGGFLILLIIMRSRNVLP